MSAQPYSPPSETTHFLVTGGGKGITAVCAAAMARAFRCRFTLLGRSQLLSEEPGWAQGLDEEAALKGAAAKHFQAQGKASPREIAREVNRVLSNREIQRTLAEIEAAGGSAQYLSADITDPADLEKQLGSCATVNGVLHGAGALADKTIEDKSEADFDLVYNTKVRGLKNVLTLIPPEQLDYLVLFSSVAGFYGNAGQTDYSLGNELLNKLALHLQQTLPDCQVLSLGWGPWDGGMVTPQLKRIFTRLRIPLITPEAGAQALVQLLERRQPAPQLVIGSPLPYPALKPLPELRTYRIERGLSLAKNPFLADHVIGGKAVLPTVCASDWFINSCQGLFPSWHYFSIRDLQVLKGIIFEDEASEKYLLELQEVEKNGEKIRLQGRISSRREDGRKIWHYQAEVELRSTLPECPRITGFNLNDENVARGADLYASRVLFHGPSFRGVERVLNVFAEGLTTSCRIEPGTGKPAGQFPAGSFNPFLADVHLQSMLLWSHLQVGSIGLPLKIASGIQYRPAPAGTRTYATMRVRSLNDRRLVADMTSHDENGLVYGEVSGAEITLNRKLYELFRDNQLEKEPAWI